MIKHNISVCASMCFCMCKREREKEGERGESTVCLIVNNHNRQNPSQCKTQNRVIIILLYIVSPSSYVSTLLHTHAHKHKCTHPDHTLTPSPLSLPICRSFPLPFPPLLSLRLLGEDGSLGVCQQQYHRMRMYCLLSPIINAAIYATVPSHNRWPISTQPLFIGLSQASAVPKPPTGEIEKLLYRQEAQKLSFVKNSSSGSLVNWQLPLPLPVGRRARTRECEHRSRRG